MIIKFSADEISQQGLSIKTPEACYTYILSGGVCAFYGDEEDWAGWEK